MYTFFPFLMHQSLVSDDEAYVSLEQLLQKTFDRIDNLIDTFYNRILLLTNLLTLTYLNQTNNLKQIKKIETYQKATKTSAKVSNSENAANTIQYIIHFT